MNNLRENHISFWENMYQRVDHPRQLGWYLEELDTDFDNELNNRKITSGTVLDIGTGQGTQAIALSKKGFSVTGTDISNRAIQYAKQVSSNVTFIIDDILDSSLPAREYDCIFDRGAFHTLPPNERQAYLRSVKRLLRDDGILFLKCFSTKQRGLGGPHRFSARDLKQIFDREFTIVKLENTVFHGTNNPHPQAIFAVIKKK